MKEYIKNMVDKTIKEANKIFNVDIKGIPIYFDLKGGSAGMFSFYRNIDGSVKDLRLRFNLDIAEANKSDYDRTIIHEVAHYVADFIYGHKIKPHGREWKFVAMSLGIPTKATHNYTIPTSTRRLKYFKYTCDCRTHEISSIIHNKILRGQLRICSKCKGKLNYLE